MKITPIVIDRFAKFILGGVAFETLKRIVTKFGNTTLTGPQKRESVISEFKVYGYMLGEMMLNLGVELAVAWLKSKQGKL